MAVKFAEGSDITGRKRGLEQDHGFFSGRIDSAIDRRKEFFLLQQGKAARVVRLNELPEDQLRKRTEDEFATLLVRMRRPRKCAMCSETFTLASSLGRRECVWHPKKLCTRTWRWTCCDMPYDVRTDGTGVASGCCKCDHYHLKYDSRNPILMDVPIVVGLICKIPHFIRAEEERKKKGEERKARNIRETRKIALTTQDPASELVYLPDPTPRPFDKPINHILLLKIQGVL